MFRLCDCRWFVFRQFGLHLSTFLRSLASRPLQAFHRYYERSDSCPALAAGQVSPLHAHELPAIPSPTTECSPPSLTLPFGAAGRPDGQTSPLNRRLADTSGRIEFVILRTGRSPPVASHPASRRRSYDRIHAGERIRGEDLHLTIHVRSRAHDSRFRGNDKLGRHGL